MLLCPDWIKIASILENVPKCPKASLRELLAGVPCADMFKLTLSTVERSDLLNYSVWKLCEIDCSTFFVHVNNLCKLRTVKTMHKCFSIMKSQSCGFLLNLSIILVKYCKKNIQRFVNLGRYGRWNDFDIS